MSEIDWIVQNAASAFISPCVIWCVTTSIAAQRGLILSYNYEETFEEYGTMYDVVSVRCLCYP